MIYLHLELRKISRKIDLIFGTQMTIEMGCYFAFIALSFQQIIIHTISTSNNILVITLLLIVLFQYIFRLFFLNYECERVSNKANASGNFISNLSYSNCDVEIRENILQFLLMTQSPIRFCGLGLFQFGFKFLQRFATSVVTVLVILLQAYINN
ncbi:uncharacterized protein [Anoplolepis gracilipes]|uniref:uncharacterized protein n=1 Tax=Anoplolepis gracilipes TaxID=354296 RepID=UPI003BA10D1A